MKLLTVEEVGEILSASPSKIYAMKDAGELPYYKVGGSVRFSLDDVLAYLASVRVEKTEEPRKTPRPRLKHIKL